MEKIIAGLVQMDSGPDMNENMRMAEQYVREAAEQGAKLILFPETAEYTGADMPGHASAVPGYVSRRFSSLAKRYGVYLHCGSMTVRRHPGRPSNTSFLFGPDGETIAEYSKIHMFDVNIPGSVSYEESHEICPGNEIVLADTALGLFGMSICYDIRFPEQYRLMASSGADAFLIAADFTKTTGERTSGSSSAMSTCGVSSASARISPSGAMIMEWPYASNRAFWPHWLAAST